MTVQSIRKIISKQEFDANWNMIMIQQTDCFEDASLTDNSEYVN